MATTTDQIQADIERTRARMSQSIEGPRYSRPAQPTSMTDSIADQIRDRPLVALGLSLLAGSLLKDYFGGGQSSATSSSTTRYTGGYTSSPYSGAAPSAGRTVSRGIDNAVDTAGDVARGASDMARDAARTVADTASDVTDYVVDTTGDVARQVADTTGYVAHEVRETAGEAVDQVTDTLGSLTHTISEQVRQRPLITVGLALYAGSLLKDYLAGSSSRSSGYTGGSYTTGRTTGAYGSSYGGGRASGAYEAPYGAGARTSAGQTVRQGVANAADTVGDAASSVVDTTANAASAVANTAANAASAVVDTTVDVAGAVADKTADVAGAVADTTVSVARQVADTTGDALHQVNETAGDVIEYAGDFYSNLSRQVQERPLTALSVAIGAGMLLQPTLRPHIQAFTQDIGSPVRTAGSGIGSLVSLPEQDELSTIRGKLVPATVERAKQFTNRELRDYLDTSLSGVVGQTSLRAGVVAAATEKAEELVSSRLSGTLERILSGTPGLLAIALTGAFLQARNQAQQGQGQTLTNIKNDVARSLTQTANDQLMRYFPAFRTASESPSSGAQRCTNCGTELTPGARFCPSCGTAV